MQSTRGRIGSGTEWRVSGWVTEAPFRRLRRLTLGVSILVSCSLGEASADLITESESRTVERQIDSLGEQVSRLAATVRDQCAGTPMQDERIDDVWEQLTDLRDATEKHHRQVGRLLNAVTALAVAMATLGSVLWYRQRRTDGRVRVIRLADTHKQVRTRD